MESRTRRRVSGTLIAAFAASSWASASASSGSVEQAGVFALVGGTPKIASKLSADRVSGPSSTLTIQQFTPGGKPLVDYDADMEHVMHLIIVRDDFATFAHLHPNFDTTTGTFWQAFTKEPNHRYYIYADSMPHGIGEQVFRFTLQSFGPVARSAPALAVSPRTGAVGPYDLRLSKTVLSANRRQSLHITVLENGNPAQDLGPYLGAAAHVIFINTSTLAYVHVHPTLRANGNGQSPNSGTDMSSSAGEMGASGAAGPFMKLAIPPLPAGIYKLWIQFMGGGRLYTAPLTIQVR